MSRSLFLLVAVLLLAIGSVSGTTCPAYDTTTLTGYSWPGFDLYHVPAANVSACSAACCATALCQAFTFQVATATATNCTVGSECCYLKYQVQDPVAVADKSSIAGLVLPVVPEEAQLFDWYILTRVTANTTGAWNVTLFVEAVLVDVSINLAMEFNLSAATIYRYLRLSTNNEYSYDVSANVVFYIMAPIYYATGITADVFGNTFSLQLAPKVGGWGTFYAPNSGAILSGEVVMQSYASVVAFPLPAVLGEGVYDAQTTLEYALLAYPKHNNNSLWQMELKADIATNIAWLTNVTNPASLLPFISIQSPAANINPASLRLSVGYYTEEYTLTFTLSAYITTVTGPYFTPDVLLLAFKYLAAGDNNDQNLFVPFAASNIHILAQDYVIVNDLAPSSGSSSTGSSGSTVCQASSDESITFQATLAGSNITGSSAAEFVQLVQLDVAWMFAELLDTFGIASSYEVLNTAQFVPYVQLVWPFVNSSGGVSVVESYSATTNKSVQPLANRNDYFFVKFNLLNTVSCVFDGAEATTVAEILFNPETFNAYGSIYTPITHLTIIFGEEYLPVLQPVVLSGAPLCTDSQTLPSCSYIGYTNTTANSVVATFVMSLGYPIITVADFNSRLQADIVGNFQLLGKNSADALIPYVLITSINSATLSSTVVQFEVLGSVSALGLSAVVVVETFAAQAAMGNLSLPSVGFYYTATVPAQAVSTTVVGGASIGTSGSSSSSGSAVPSGSSGYPAGSVAIVFYVVIESITELFAIEIQEDIALNLATIAGIGATSDELLLPFVVVTNINGTAISPLGQRRLLQAATTGSQATVSFVLLGSVSGLGSVSANISASALSQGFANKAQQGTLQTPASGASAPAQNVSTSAVGGGMSSSSSSTGGVQATGTNGAAVGSAVSVATLLVAVVVALALLL